MGELAFTSGTLSRLFLGAAIGASALTAHLMTDSIAQYIADKHEPAQITTGGVSLNSAFSLMRGGGSEDHDAQNSSPTPAAKQTVATPIPDDIDPEIEWAEEHDMSDPKVKMYLAKKAYRSFASGTSDNDKYKAMSDLHSIMGNGNASGEEWQHFIKETGFSQKNIYKAIGEYSALAVAELKQKLERTPPGDMVTRSNILEDMRIAYNDVTTSEDGAVWNGGPTGEARRKAITGLSYDDILPLQAEIRQAAAGQGYSIVMAYRNQSPQTEADWKRYQDSISAIQEHVSFAKPENKDAIYGNLGMSENQWEAMRDQADREKRIHDLEAQGIKKPESSVTSVTHFRAPAPHA